MGVVVAVLKEDFNLTVQKIDNRLESFKSIVKGFIECVPIDRTGIQAIVNEEGKMRKMKPQIFILNKGDYLVGPIIFARLDETNGEFIDLTEKDINYIKEYIVKNRVEEL